MIAVYVLLGILALLLIVTVVPSIRFIGPNQIGLVTKRFGLKKLPGDNPIALNGEVGYQADLLMPGWWFKLWINYSVRNFPWIQIPAGEIGVVIAQVGEPLPPGAKSAEDKTKGRTEVFSNLRQFIESGGQKGVQRPVLPPGTLAPVHPAGFLVITKEGVYGLPISEELRSGASKNFGLQPKHLSQMIIDPSGQYTGESERETRDVIGIVTTLEGQPLPAGDIASRLEGFKDIETLESQGAPDSDLIEATLGGKNWKHNNYQDFQEFLDSGGKIGLQHDPLLYGAYNLNPFLVRVDIAPMLVVEQGEVAVIKSYVGQVSQDTSGKEFKYGQLVKPGHRGIWSENLRTGKYPINPHCYQSVIVPTAILTLNWAEAVSEAHKLDTRLVPIVAKSREGFVFKIDLQVQIHIPDVQASRVISIVGTIENLVDEVLQAAVGNYFRNKLQSIPAVKFIEQRDEIQQEAQNYVREKLAEYEVETLGVYIQDVILPEQLVVVLTDREIANQKVETFKKEKEAEDQRIQMENAKGTANKQSELAASKVGIDIKRNNADARKLEAEGEASYIAETGKAQAAEVRAVALAKAEGYQEQVKALGQSATAIVNVADVMRDSKLKIVPEVLVTGGGNGSLDALLSTLAGKFLKPPEKGTTPKTTPYDELTEYTDYVDQD